jgi:predicted MFS family arabinose efflux permease
MRLSRLAALLLSVDFLDELVAGAPMVGAPGIRDAFGIGYTVSGGTLFTLPLLVSLVLEPPVFVLADRFGKKPFVCGGLALLALLYLIAGLAPNYVTFAAALALTATASGWGVSLSQAALMDAYPDARERNMARWTLMGALGDLAAPGLFVALAFVSAGWRQAFLVCGGLLALWALGLAFVHFPGDTPTAKGDTHVSFGQALRAALMHRPLLIWLTASWLCFLLDEILIAFGALYMRDILAFDNTVRNAILMMFAIGCVVGLLVTDRAVAHHTPRRLLWIASAGCLISYIAWLMAGTSLSSGFWMLWVGVFTGPQYAVVQAQAYRALPNRSGLVNALGHLFMPLTVLAPLGIGFVSDRFGLGPALLILALQPLGLMLIVIRDRSAC